MPLQSAAASRAAPGAAPGAASVRDALRIAELERELEAARAELAEGARTLEASSQEQRAVNEEALSANEAYQSINEELLSDIARRTKAAAALEEAKAAAEAASLAKSRFLAAASHDLRQPLQMLAVLQALLVKAVAGDKAIGLVKRMDEMLGSMSGMLDTLRDLNQIEAGVAKAELEDCRIARLLDRLRDQFVDPAQANGPGLRAAACSATMARHGFVQLARPPSPPDVIRTSEHPPSCCAPGERATAQSSAGPDAPAGGPVIFVVDDDRSVRAALRILLEGDGRVVEDYSGSAAFLAAFGAGRPGRNACLLVDAAMPGINGLELLEQLSATGRTLPAIVITGHGDVAMAVRAMKAGALDFIEKPVRAPELLASVVHALDHSRDAGAQAARQAEAATSLVRLTPRQRDVMAMVLAGNPSKKIATDLGISQRTVEHHRACIMRKTGARSLPALARLALAANPPGQAGSRP